MELFFVAGVLHEMLDMANSQPMCFVFWPLMAAVVLKMLWLRR